MKEDYGSKQSDLDSGAESIGGDFNVGDKKSCYAC